MNRNTSPMGDVLGMDIEYSHGKVRPSINEFEMSDDGYDLLVPADGSDDFYGGDGGGSGDDFYNADSDSPDAYMPDGMAASGDFYGAAGEEDYSNLTLWSKDKRKKFSKNVSKAADKVSKVVKQGVNLAKGIAPSGGTEAPPPIAAPMPAASEPTKKGMTTGVKVAIGVGVVVLGAIAWYLFKGKK